MPKRPDPDYQSQYAELPCALPALTPIAIMPSTMRLKFGDGERDGATDRIAAPYLHPRVPATALGSEFAGLSDAELDALNFQE